MFGELGEIVLQLSFRPLLFLAGFDSELFVRSSTLGDLSNGLKWRVRSVKSSRWVAAARGTQLSPPDSEACRRDLVCVTSRVLFFSCSALSCPMTSPFLFRRVGFGRPELLSDLGDVCRSGVRSLSTR